MANITNLVKGMLRTDEDNGFDYVNIEKMAPMGLIMTNLEEFLGEVKELTTWILINEDSTALMPMLVGMIEAGWTVVQSEVEHLPYGIKYGLWLEYQG